MATGLGVGERWAGTPAGKGTSAIRWRPGCPPYGATGFFASAESGNAGTSRGLLPTFCKESRDPFCGGRHTRVPRYAHWRPPQNAPSAAA
jgi:hypothetical protein